MEKNAQNSGEKKEHADFVGESDPVTNIFILWMIKKRESGTKTFSINHFPEMPEELKNLLHISGEMEVVMDLFCGNTKGKFMMGSYIHDPRKQNEMGLALDNISGHNNLFVIYRAIRALSYFPKISYPSDMVKAAHAFDYADKYHKKAKKWLMEIIGKDLYEDIAKDVPPELEEAVDALILRGINLDKTPFEDEVKRGHINSRVLMKTLGIRTPEEEVERTARLEKLVEPYWEYMAYYFKDKKYPAVSKEIADKLKKHIYEAKARGIDSYTDAIAVALIAYYRGEYLEKVEHESRSGAISQEERNRKINETELGITRQIAEDFAKCFTEINKSSEELFQLYGHYMRYMDSMEPVDLLG